MTGRSRSPRARFRCLVLTAGLTSSWELPRQLAVDVVDEVGGFVRGRSRLAQRALGPATSCYLVGGEPCDDLDALLEVTAAVKRNGFFMQVVTWGYWSATDRLGDSLDAVKRHTDLLMISVSARRARAYGVGHVELLVAAARAREIPCSLQLVLDDGDTWPLELLSLPTLSQESLIVLSVPSYGDRRGSTDDPDWWLSEVPPFRCRELFGLIVVPNGDVYPCSPMVGVESMRLGNMRTDPIERIVNEGMTRPDLGELAEHGPRGLCAAAAGAGAGEHLPTAFADACDFHRQFLSNPRLLQIARGWRPAPLET